MTELGSFFPKSFYVLFIYPVFLHKFGISAGNSDCIITVPCECGDAASRNFLEVADPDWRKDRDWSPSATVKTVMH